jgi:hypothetical protein
LARGPSWPGKRPPRSGAQPHPRLRERERIATYYVRPRSAFRVPSNRAPAGENFLGLRRSSCQSQSGERRSPLTGCLEPPHPPVAICGSFSVSCFVALLLGACQPARGSWLVARSSSWQWQPKKQIEWRVARRSTGALLVAGGLGAGRAAGCGLRAAGCGCVGGKETKGTEGKWGSPGEGGAWAWV